MLDILTFHFYQDLCQTKETAALALEVIGLDFARGAYAALTAHVCRSVGHIIDPQSD
jgi:hypothetical protein